MHCQFLGVKGYAGYNAAVKRGVAAARPSIIYRWVVIALPNGRFTPLVICNDAVPGGPGQFLGEHNICIIN